MNYYKTGQFAKMANVTERTIRYYDKIGLLKPSFVMPNGYRQYTDKDLLKLQKITSLKHLGFPIEEIFPLVSNDEDIKDSMQMQLKLLDSRISHLEGIRETMLSILKSADSGDIDWNRIVSLVQMSNDESSIVENYKNAKHLDVRISLHDRYSTNKTGWFPWLLSQIDFTTISRLLEIGCGNGDLWSSCKINLRNREIFLSDSSKGMVDVVREKMGNDFNCIVVDCQKISFKNEYFDSVIANHVLFYVNDLNAGLLEICRVLRDEGILYCTTYGKDHMKEINEIVSSFDSRIKLSSNYLYDKFGLENGKDILSPYFKSVELKLYEDSLEITESQPLIDYIMSCHGNQNELLGPRLIEFKLYVNELIATYGTIHVTKQAGLFVCKK